MRIVEPVEPRDIVERVAVLRQAMGLVVADHLQPVLDHPQAVVAFAQQTRIAFGNDPLRRQRVERGARAAHPQRRLAPAMDQLVGLGEEFDFADPAAPALEVETRPRAVAARRGASGCGRSAGGFPRSPRNRGSCATRRGGSRAGSPRPPRYRPPPPAPG